MVKQSEFFTSRWGLILSVLGIAIGTGNIWRFSRVVAQNGGGSFLIPWVVFLLIWSLPLIIAEFAMGMSARMGPVGAITKFAGKKFAWMGAFIALVSTAIMFYYSVVTGWCIRYFVSAITGDLFSTTSHISYWEDFSGSGYPLFYHIIAIAIASIIIYRGVVKGIEKANKFLVSTLLFIILILLIRAVTLPNAMEGLKFFFTPDLSTILDHKVWLNALTQNAWDTGAGWGLILTYAIYMRKRKDVTVNAALIGFGNNSISLIAGMIIFSTVFALSSSDALLQITQSGPANTGLTFIYLPLLFSKISDILLVNIFFASIFFIALSFAAMSSLISLMELTTRTFIDFGFSRKRAIIFVAVSAIVLGAPSAVNTDFFLNQDWVWGMGLILSGAFISFSIIRYGVNNFRENIINQSDSDIKLGKWYNIIIQYFIPVQAVILLSWWLIFSVSWDPEWWNPFHVQNVGTCLAQWAIVLSVFIYLNKKIVKSLRTSK